jgi:hypothetical protein
MQLLLFRGLKVTDRDNLFQIGIYGSTYLISCQVKLTCIIHPLNPNVAADGQSYIHFKGACLQHSKQTFFLSSEKSYFNGTMFTCLAVTG